MPGGDTGMDFPWNPLRAAGEPRRWLYPILPRRTPVYHQPCGVQGVPSPPACCSVLASLLSDLVPLDHVKRAPTENRRLAGPRDSSGSQFGFCEAVGCADIILE